MTGYQFNRFLGVLYTTCGGILFFYIAWAFLLRAIVALAALYLISYGLRLQGYPLSRFIFMAQRWRSRF